MASVSDKPWSQFTKADYTPEQYRRACLIDTGQGDPDSKDRYKLPVREPDGALNRNGVHAAAGGHGVGAVQGVSPDKKRAAARTLVGLYRSQLGEDPPPGLLEMAGMAAAGRARSLDDESWSDIGQVVTRAVPLDDMSVRSGRITCDTCHQDATGRIVDAVMVPFEPERALIDDEQGRYWERYAPTSFNRRIEHVQRARAGLYSVGVFYNHGKTIYDTPAAEFSVPIGHPMAVRADSGRGVITSTHYSTDPFADRILSNIKDGNIGGQSFTGPIIDSDPKRIPRVRRGNDLPSVRRLEMGLIEYGPTPLPFFEKTPVLAMRAAHFGQPEGAEPPPEEDGDQGGAGRSAGRTYEEVRRAAQSRRLLVRRMLDNRDS